MGRPPRTLSSVAQELLFKGIERNGCVICHLATDSGGYAQTYYGSAHRVVWRGLFGHTDLMILHTCDVRNCIQPDHLFKGTCQDNVDDMIAKGRRVNGKQLRVISEEQRAEMRELNDNGYSQGELSKIFGVSRSTVARNLRDEYDPR